MSGFDFGPALLFCPADRPDRYAKAAERSDAVILDLEDAVAPADKERARDALIATPLDPARTIVRLNPAGTPAFARDLTALAETGYTTVMLAKAEDPAAAHAVGDRQVIALCETAAGILAARDLAAAPNVVALMWGAEDLVASLGGTSSRHGNGSYREVARYARSQVLLAAAAASKAAVDAIYADIKDLDGLAAEAADAVASGFRAKASIHPGQIPVVRAAYAPTAGQIADARELLDAAEGQGGVFSFRGRMVDEPILRHARQILQRAGN